MPPKAFRTETRTPPETLARGTGAQDARQLRAARIDKAPKERTNRSDPSCTSEHAEEREPLSEGPSNAASAEVRVGACGVAHAWPARAAVLEAMPPLSDIVDARDEVILGFGVHRHRSQPRRPSKEEATVSH